MDAAVIEIQRRHDRHGRRLHGMRQRPPPGARASSRPVSKDLTLICNDASMPGYGVAKLVEEKRLRRLIASHVGTQPGGRPSR